MMYSESLNLEPRAQTFYGHYSGFRYYISHLSGKGRAVLRVY